MDNAINDELVEFLKMLLERQELTGVIQGIAKQVTTRGVDSMTDTQRGIVNNYVQSYKSKNECNVCSNDNVSDLTDYIEIADEGVCATCQRNQEKFLID